MPSNATVKTVSARNYLAFLFIGLAVVITGVVLFHSQHVIAPTKPAPKRPTQVQLEGSTFSIRVADTPALWAQGLSGTSQLPSDEAMLFIFDQPETACFWMKDMHYNLDILWFDTGRHLIYEEQNLSPATYPNSFCAPGLTAYVLEVNAGTAQRLHVKLGDSLGF